jgi:hypothetical protein
MLDKIVELAIEELDEWLDQEVEEYLTMPDPGDTIFEIADSSVPVYNSDLLDCASDNYTLVTTVPELGPAFDGEATAINIIAANVFEYLTEQLWDHFQSREDELERMVEELELESEQED